MTVATALQQGQQLLADGAIAEPRLTAEVLLGHALRRERVYLYTHPEHELSEIEWIHYGRYLHERLAGKPTQYITRVQEFYGRPFRVSPDVLIPRPETEHVIEKALSLGLKPRMALDIGCGSGALAVTAALELHCPVVATDISAAALRVAAANARDLKAQVEFVCCDLASAFRPVPSFDLIVSNPPYIPEPELAGIQREVRDFEPRVALVGGERGHEMYLRIIPQAEALLVPGGWLIFEIGYRAADAVQAAFDPEHWSGVEVMPDLAGLPRVLSAQRK